MKKTKDALALVLSSLFTPPLVAALAIFVIVIFYSHGYPKAIAWTFISVFLLIGPASICILISYYLGTIKDLNLSEREERLRPLSLSLLGAMIGTMIMLSREVPSPLLLAGFTLISELVVVIFITLFWKISMHTLTISAITTLLVLIFNGWLAMLYLLIFPVAWARIYRKRHTLAQVSAGALVGAATALLVFTLFQPR
jgi:membrane-associated phospholipid phosphatase